MEMSAKLHFNTYKTKHKEYNAICITLKDNSKNKDLSSIYDNIECEFLKQLTDNGYDAYGAGCPKETKDCYIDFIKIELARENIIESKRHIENIWEDVKNKLIK